jgi:hypothetical protein
MGAFHHKLSEYDHVCRWCQEPWPCLVAEVRRECADKLRKANEHTCPKPISFKTCNCPYYEEPDEFADLIDYKDG